MLANVDEVTAQVDKFESDQEERKAEQGEKVKSLKAADKARRPRRFRLDNIDPSGS